MSDTPESVRQAVEDWKRALELTKIAVHEPVLAGMCDRYAILLEQHKALKARVAEHQKVCAGVWVPVGARLPEISGWYYCVDDIGDLDERMCVSDDGEMRFIGHLHQVTHWLDVNLPGEQHE